MVRTSNLNPGILTFAKTMRYCTRILLAAALALFLLSPEISYLAEAAAGDLDPTFGMAGKVKTDFFGGWDEVRAVAIQSDNKVVAVGLADSPSFARRFGLARYNPDGSLDFTFGSGGKVITNVSGGDEAAEDVAIQPDGKIVVAGHEGSLSGLSNFVVARYNPNGSLDATFGSGGAVKTPFLRTMVAALAIALQPDGKIIAAGTGLLNLEPGGGLFNVSVMTRYNPDGSLDQTFGMGGRVTTNGSGIGDLALQPDGKIVAAAGFSFLILRLNTDGSPDMTFGSGGQVDNPPLGGVAMTSNGVAIQADGKIVCVGGAVTPPSHNVDFGVVRLNTNGTVDATFGAGGVAKVDLGNEEAAQDVAIQLNGRIVVSGTSNSRFAVARFNSNGAFDNTFNVMTPDFGCANPGVNPVSIAYGVAIYPNGKIIAGGFACSPRDFVLARYEGDTMSQDVCIQDESNGNILRLNPDTGDYQFTACRIGLVVGGRGTLTRRGDILTLQDFGSNRRVSARIEGSAGRATASVQLFSPVRTFTIADRNTGNNNCNCP